VAIVTLDHYEPPALAKALRVLGRFWIAHWKWIITIAITIAGILTGVWF
jgi:hypothetical protein